MKPSGHRRLAIRDADASSFYPIAQSKCCPDSLYAINWLSFERAFATGRMRYARPQTVAPVYRRTPGVPPPLDAASRPVSPGPRRPSSLRYLGAGTVGLCKVPRKSALLRGNSETARLQAAKLLLRFAVGLTHEFGSTGGVRPVIGNCPGKYRKNRPPSMCGASLRWWVPGKYRPESRVQGK